MRLRPKLVIETIGGVPALESPWVRPLAAIGFHSNGRALIYDGLPGPSTSIARTPLHAASALTTPHSRSALKRPSLATFISL